jgi:hypothetical protein
VTHGPADPVDELGDRRAGPPRTAANALALAEHPTVTRKPVHPTMPHQQSLYRRIGELRRAHTGETDSSLWPAAQQGPRSLDREERTERQIIIDVLDNGFETRPLGGNPFPTVGERPSRCPTPTSVGGPPSEATPGS